MPLVQNSTQTKQISIIGPHDSHSRFLPFLLCKRLTLTVLSQYSTTLAYHDQNKLQHKQNTWSISIFHLLDVSSSSLCSLQNKVPSLITTFSHHYFFFNNQMHAQQIDITHGLLFSLLTLSIFYTLFNFSFLQHYNNKNTTTDYSQPNQLFCKPSFKSITALYAL